MHELAPAVVEAVSLLLPVTPSTAADLSVSKQAGHMVSDKTPVLSACSLDYRCTLLFESLALTNMTGACLPEAPALTDGRHGVGVVTVHCLQQPRQSAQLSK